MVFGVLRYSGLMGSAQAGAVAQVQSDLGTSNCCGYSQKKSNCFWKSTLGHKKIQVICINCSWFDELHTFFNSFSITGKAVFLARDKHHLADLSHLIRHEAPYLFQKYIKESHGRDVRVIVVGGRVVGTMLRCSTDGRMQSNCSLGKAMQVSFWDIK